MIATRRQPEAPAGLEGRIDLLRPEQLPELMSQSDFIVLALPLTSGTEDMFDAGLLSQAKEGAWLINVARGALVDERALVRAVSEGPLGGAVLDAFRNEPLPPDSPLIQLAEHHRHAAYVVVEWPRARAQHRPLLREP